MIIRDLQGYSGRHGLGDFAGRSGKHGLGGWSGRHGLGDFAGHSGQHGLGDTLANIESTDAPSRSLWFLVGAVTAFLGPTLLGIAVAGGGKAARRLGR